MIKKIFKLFILIYFTSFILPYSLERKICDVMQLALPVTAISSTYYMNDYDGFKSFLKSYITTISTTYVLKNITHKLRPDGTDYMSFPSGHTSSAFAGASFVHFRYGIKYSIPLYLLAGFTGYSRIESNKHYIEDVIAGAGLAILSSWYFTLPYSKKYSFYLNYNRNSKMIKLNLVKLF